MTSIDMRQTDAARRSRWAAADAFGDWLDRLQYDDAGELEHEWDYWATWTFREQRTDRAVRRAIESHLERIGVSRAFWGMESGKVNGRLHGHGLLHFARQIPPQAKDIWQDWFKRHGRAHVDQFEQKKGASHYVSKYVSKDLADYDLQGADIGGLG